MLRQGPRDGYEVCKLAAHASRHKLSRSAVSLPRIPSIFREQCRNGSTLEQSVKNVGDLRLEGMFAALSAGKSSNFSMHERSAAKLVPRRGIT